MSCLNWISVIGFWKFRSIVIFIGRKEGVMGVMNSIR